MKNKRWLMLVILGICLIAVLLFVNGGRAQQPEIGYKASTNTFYVNSTCNENLTGWLYDFDKQEGINKINSTLFATGKNLTSVEIGAFIQLGDPNAILRNQTWYNDSKKQITLSLTAVVSTYNILILRNATVRFGNYTITPTNTTNGISLFTTYKGSFIQALIGWENYANITIYFYGCQFNGQDTITSKLSGSAAGDKAKIYSYNCLYERITLTRCSAYLYNNIFSMGTISLSYVNVNESNNNYFIGGVYPFQAGTTTSNIYVQNATCIDMQTIYKPGSTYSGTIVLENVYSNTYLIDATFSSTGKLFVKYPIRLRILESNNTPLSNANVNITEFATQYVYYQQHNLTTDSQGYTEEFYLVNYTFKRGTIEQKNVTHLINISKNGYEPIYINTTINQETNWTLIMFENITLDVTENLVNCVGGYDYSWDSILHRFFFWLNYTGTGGGTNGNLTLKNWNPGNSTNDGYNYLQANPLGINCSVDVSCKNFSIINETNNGLGNIFDNFSTGSYINHGALISDIFFCENLTMQNTFVLKNISIFLGINPFNCNIWLNVSKVKNGIPTFDYVSHCTNIVHTTMLDSDGWYNFNMTPVVLYKDNEYAILVNGETDGIPDFWCADFSGTDYVYGSVWSWTVGSWTNFPFNDFFFNCSGWSLGGNISWTSIINLTFCNQSGAIFDQQFALWNGTYGAINTNYTMNNTVYSWYVTGMNPNESVNTSMLMFTTATRKMILPVEQNNNANNYNNGLFVVGLMLVVPIGLIVYRIRRR